MGIACVADSVTSARGAKVKRRRGGVWSITARDALMHARMLAIAFWSIAALWPFLGTGMKDPAGHLRGVDFINFYTMGVLARTGRVSEIYDFRAFHRAQTAVVPASRDNLYPPVYPPQTALLFAPLTVISYGKAAWIWALLSIAAYLLIVRAAIRITSGPVDHSLLWAGALAFPPFWLTVMNGQVTMILLGTFFAAWMALRRRQNFLAGAALGLVAIKPQFGLPLVVVVIAGREWAMLAGAAASVATQVAVIWLTMGSDALRAYWTFIPAILGNADVLEAKPFNSHSIRSLTRLLPAPIGAMVWTVASGWVLWQVAAVWRSTAPLSIRFGTTILAAVLVNPHLIVYDATVLVLPLIWFGDWLSDCVGAREAATYGTSVYWLCAALLFPLAAIIKVQPSVFLMLWMLAHVSRLALSRVPPTGVPGASTCG